MEPTGNKVIFGAPYSPDMNPIENIFGIWKKRVDEAIGDSSPSLDALVDIIHSIWENMEPQIFTNCEALVFEKVFPKVMNMIDL